MYPQCTHFSLVVSANALYPQADKYTAIESAAAGLNWPAIHNPIGHDQGCPIRTGIRRPHPAKAAFARAEAGDSRRSARRHAAGSVHHGQVIPPSDRVPALCAVLAITPNELFDGTCRPMPLKDGGEKVA